MDSTTRRLPLVLLLLFMLMVSARGVPSSRSLKTIKEEVIGDFQYVEGARRMNIEVNDYPGTGANHNHDPTPPGKKG